MLKECYNISGSEGYESVKRVVGNDTLASMVTLIATTKVVVIALGSTHHPTIISDDKSGGYCLGIAHQAAVIRITTTKGTWSLYF